MSEEIPEGFGPDAWKNHRPDCICPDCDGARQDAATPDFAPVTVYVSIGNSDDKLSQFEWSRYVVEMTARVAAVGHPHGQWASNPVSVYQNACWCVEFRTDAEVTEAREVATEIRKKYRQDSVAWAVVTETEFL